MADIFISYSSKDREEADRLTEMLSSAGLSVWIDKAGIGAATSWSAEIVDAINACTAFIVLLSPHSVESHNVIKEVSLASEKRKKILPLDLVPVALPRDLEYQLAGIQRTTLTNIDSIIRALGRFGLEATQAPTYHVLKEDKGKAKDDRKSLMILPFEDLSPTGDNGWFADGIVSELIDALTNIRSLRIADNQATKEFRNFHGQLSSYAQTMNIRYFVQGDVRKFGDQIKISSRLLDIETGDHLWQDSMKGTMDDIFDIQENVAKKVVEGLKIILTHEEKTLIEEQPTENPEAYELYLKAKQYYDRHNRVDMDRSLSIYEEVVRLDPKFADAYLNMANTALAYYRAYDRSPATIGKVHDYLDKASQVMGESKEVLWVRGILARTLGDYETSLGFLERAIKLDPDFPQAYEALSMAHALQNNIEELVRARANWVRLMPSDRNARFSYLLAVQKLNDVPRLREAAQEAIPIFERYLRLTPDDTYARSQFTGLLCMAEEFERGIAEGKKLEETGNLDGYALCNLGCAYIHAGDIEHGMEILDKCVKTGYRNMDVFRLHPDLDRVRDRPEFKAIMKEVEDLIAAEKKS